MPIQKVKKIWMNREFVDWDDANVHILTHALHYGSGVFEGIRCYKTADGPAVFRHREHMERLHNSAKIYQMEIPYSVEELMDATKELIRENGLEECYIRPIAYRGYGEMGLNPMNVPIDVAIAVWPWGAYLGDEGIKNGIRTMISSFQRISPKSLPPFAKCTGTYVNSILSKLESLHAGCDEAIVLDYRGFISEGPGENLFMIKSGKIFTPPEHASILVGITRDTAITIARDLGYDVVETDITRGQLYLADELFFTGTAAEITPIREVDGIEIEKPWPITKAIQEKFYATIKGKDQNYKDWLDYV